MSRYGNTDYNSGGQNSSGSSSDYEEREDIKLDRYATIEGNLESIGMYSGDNGESFIINLDDVVVTDGVIMERGDGKYKVFGWDQWFDRDPETMELIPYDGDDEVSIDDIPKRHTEQFGSNSYKYELIDGVIESKGDEPFEIGDAKYWASNTTKGRTMAKVFSTYGHDIVADKDNDYDWLALDTRSDDFPLRDDLQDRRIMLWFEEDSFTPEDRDEPVQYTDAVILDAKTEAGITIDNNAIEADTSGGSVDSSSSSETQDTATTDGGIPPGVDELVDVFARSEQTNRERVEHMVEKEVDDIDEIDMDAVMGEIETRIAR